MEKSYFMKYLIRLLCEKENEKNRKTPWDRYLLWTIFSRFFAKSKQSHGIKLKVLLKLLVKRKRIGKTKISLETLLDGRVTRFLRFPNNIEKKWFFQNVGRIQIVLQ